DQPPALVAIEADPQVTLTSAGARVPLLATARLSDGTVLDAARGPNTAFTSSDPTIVEATADGAWIARGEGVATSTIADGNVRGQVQVAVEFRTPAVVTGIHVKPLEGATADDRQILATAVLAGTGSLDGIPITFSISGLPIQPITVHSNGDGMAIAQIKPITAAT